MTTVSPVLTSTTLSETVTGYYVCRETSRGAQGELIQMSEDNNTDRRRRTVLKTLAAAGIGGAGLAGASGSAAAQGQGQGKGQGQGGSNFRRLRFDVERTGTIIDTDAAPAGFEEGEATFDGELILEDVEINDTGELVASGRLKGTLDQNPTQQINQTFETVLGLVEDILSILSPDEAGECPILELVIGPIFLDLLGLQLETNTIELDLTAVAGAGNLLGNLLCAVAGLLDP